MKTLLFVILFGLLPLKAVAETAHGEIGIRLTIVPVCTVHSTESDTVASCGGIVSSTQNVVTVTW